MTDMRGLRVVRFAGPGVREYHKLGYLIPQSNGLTRVIYADSETVCESHLLNKALEINVNIMLAKAQVLHTVDEERGALRLKIPDDSHVRCTRAHCQSSRHTWCHTWCHT